MSNADRRAMARQRAFRLGRRAERLCVWYLRLRGYRILARRERTPVGEIDIVARRGRVLAMVEVKARSSLDEAAAAISPRQRARIARAAAHFLATRPLAAGTTVRYDAMLVAPWRLPVHLPNAWRDS